MYIFTYITAIVRACSSRLASCKKLVLTAARSGSDIGSTRGRRRKERGEKLGTFEEPGEPGWEPPFLGAPSERERPHAAGAREHFNSTLDGV